MTNRLTNGERKTQAETPGIQGFAQFNKHPGVYPRDICWRLTGV